MKYWDDYGLVMLHAVALVAVHLQFCYYLKLTTSLQVGDVAALSGGVASIAGGYVRRERVCCLRVCCLFLTHLLIGLDLIFELYPDVCLL